MSVSKGDSSTTVGKEHFLVDELGLAAWRVGHKSDLTSIPDQPRRSNALLPCESVNHEGHHTATCSIACKPIIIEIGAGRERKYEPLSLASLCEILCHVDLGIGMVNLGELFVASDIINSMGACKVQL